MLPSCLLRLSCLFRLSISALAVVLATAASPAQSISFTPTWVQAASSGPSARTGSAMAYDAATGQVVLFGGFNGGSPLADTWTWNGTVWTNVTPPSPATSPSARGSAAMAYDAATGQVVLFGGYDLNNYLGDTWTWNGTAWTNVTPPSPALSPATRDDAAMAYDAATGKVVLFGGYGNTILGDTWTWNGTAWTNVTPPSPASSPTGRYGATMAYDAATGQVVLFGGDTGSYVGDTWTWNGTTWTLQGPVSSTPPQRYLSTMAYDAATEQVVLFGGDNNGGPLGDTWTWNGTTWTQQSPVTSPAARYGSTMAYDAATGQVVLFGGNINASDTWTLVLGAVNLGTANVCANGSTPAPCSQTATVNFAVGGSNVTVNNVNVLTQGAPNLDFTATATTCSGALNADTACSVTVKFAPTHPGPRYGGISLTDSSGNILSSIPLSGIGSGPQVTFPSNAAPAAVGSGFSTPGGVAVDGKGDVFIADAGSNHVKEAVAVNGVVNSGSTVNVVGSGFSFPTGVAVDGLGNVFVADQGHSVVKEIVAVNGIVNSGSTVKTIGSNFNFPEAVAVDASGNVFVADTQNGAVKKIVAVNGIVTSSSTVNLISSSFSSPYGIAVDASGDIFVADINSGVVSEIVAVNGVVDSSSAVNKVGNGFDQPSSVTVDAAGDVFVTEYTSSDLKEIIAVNGLVNSNSTVVTLANSLQYPFGVALDSSGDVFIAEGSNNSVDQLPFATPPTVAFATPTTDGSTDTTDPNQAVTVQNDGNQPLIFAIPTAAGTTNPTTPNDFTFTTTGGTACPSLTTSATAPGTLATGATCNVPLTFTPVAPSSGALTESLVFTDNNLNAASATQSLTLKGTALLPLTLSPPSGYLPNAQYNVPYSLTFTATGGSGRPYTYSFTGPLPPGLSWNQTTGGLSGTPTAAAAGYGYSFVITATASQGDLITQSYTLDVLPEPISTANSTLTALPTPAVAGSPVTVTAMVLDASHDPIVGATVDFSQTITSGGASTTAAFNATRTVTNASGLASVTLTDTAAESLTLSATVSGIASGSLNTTPVTFVAPAYTVMVATDPASANESATHCVATGLTGSNANCSLREAVDAANLLSGVTANIGFATPLFSSAQTILIAQTTPITPKTSMNIKGPGANLLTIEGGTTALSTSNTQVFLQEGGTVTLSGVTVANGHSSSFGGGIYVSTGTLTVTNSTFSGNLSSYIGGAIFSNAMLTVTNSTFSGNQAVAGGAIGADTTLTVANSTFSGNQATDQGGAIYVLSTLVVANSTFSGNQSTNQGGAILANKTLTVAESIFSGDSSSDGSGIFAEIPGNSSSVSNIVYNGDTFTAVTPANSFNASANLSSLGNYGGPTQTFLPLPGSAAICAGTQPALNGTPLATDQRGVPISATRYGQTACYDIGAVQTEYALGFTTQPSNVAPGVAMSPAPVVTITEDGAALAAGSAQVNIIDAASDLLGVGFGGRTIEASSSTTPPTVGQASFGNLTFRSPVTGDTLTVTLGLNGGVSTTAQSNAFNVTALPASTATSTVVATPSPAVAGSSATVTVTVEDAGGNAINGATASFSSTSTTAGFGTPSVNGNVITVSMTDTAAETAPVSVTLGGSASGTLSGSAQFVAPAFMVMSTSDPTSGNGTAANCVDINLPSYSAAANANCELRDAVAASNALAGVTTNIAFATPLFASAQTILIAQATPITIYASINIQGPGANLLTIEGGTTPLSGSNYSVFQEAGGPVTLSGVTIANGATQASYAAGGFTVAFGTLTLSNCAFTGNINSYGGLRAGALYDAGSLSVTACTFSGNLSVGSYSGAAINATGSSTLTVSDSTFSGNSSTGSNSGGAITDQGNSAMTVTNSTFFGNVSQSYGGAIYILSPTPATVTYSIFSDDSAVSGSGIYASYSGGTYVNLLNDSSYNYGTGDTFYSVTPNEIESAAAKLSALGYHGGTVQTFLPLPGSAAICGSNLAPSVATDQRGVPISATRYGQTACYDIGAVQTEYAMTGPLTVPSLVNPGSSVTPAPTVSLTEDGTAFTAGTATVTLSDRQNDLSSGSSATNSLTTGVVTFGSVQFTTAETTDQLTATLSLNPSTPVSLTVTSNSFQVGQLTPALAFTPAPASQVYGTAIAAGSLDATATYNGSSVAGSSTYTATSTTTQAVTALTAGVTVLPADSYTLTATFTPSNTTLYKSGLTTTAPYTVTQATQAITFTTAPPASATYNTQFSVVATGGASGVPLAYASSGGCTNVGSTYTMTSGTTACTVTVSQAGNTNYAAAPNLVVTVTAALATPTLVFAAIPPHTYGDAPFVVSASSASTGAITYGVRPGPATINAATGLVTLDGAGQVTLTASQAQTSNYTSATATPVTITIARQASTTSLSLSATAITPLQTVNLTAVVAPTVAGSVTPTQSITFFDGSTTPATQLGGSVALNGGTAVLSNVSLASGAHSLYAVYSGDSNYLVSSSTQSPSTIITVAPEDFTFTANGSVTQSVIPGTAGTFTFAVAPVYDKYPGPVTFSVTGLPPGATYTVSPSSIATNAGPQTVTVTITTPGAIAMRAVGHSAPWALALLLPVLLLKRSRRRLGHAVAAALLLSAGAFALSGCGSNANGYFGQSVQNYTVTVTGTSGTVMHSSTITLQVQ